MESSLRVDRLTAADIGLLRQLNSLFAEAFHDADSYCAAPAGDDYLADVLARDEVIVLVGSLGRTVVGGLVAYELPKLEQARSEIYIYDLAVSGTFRRRGVATH